MAESGELTRKVREQAPSGRFIFRVIDPKDSFVFDNLFIKAVSSDDLNFRLLSEEVEPDPKNPERKIAITAESEKILSKLETLYMPFYRAEDTEYQNALYNLSSMIHNRRADQLRSLIKNIQRGETSLPNIDISFLERCALRIEGTESLTIGKPVSSREFADKIKGAIQNDIKNDPTLSPEFAPKFTPNLKAV